MYLHFSFLLISIVDLFNNDVNKKISLHHQAVCLHNENLQIHADFQVRDTCAKGNSHQSGTFAYQRHILRKKDYIARQIIISALISSSHYVDCLQTNNFEVPILCR